MMVIRQVAFDPSYEAWLRYAQAETQRYALLEALDGEPSDLDYLPGELPS